MTKRLVIQLLLVAFLMSAWGNVIAASFCPTYLARNCSIKHLHGTQPITRDSCQHEAAGTKMSDMQMDDMQMDDSAPDTEPASASRKLPVADVVGSSEEQSALETRTEPCGHCWMHSQPPTGSTTLAGINPSPRSVPTPASSAEISIALPFPNPIATDPSEHSPPGNSFPRHILINVFRI